MEKSIKIKSFIAKNFDLKDNDIKSYSPLTLAYIGDGVYEIIIRTIIISNGNAPVNKFHKKASTLVKASSQAQIINLLLEELTEEELNIYKRGRNAKSQTIAKNATVIDYRMATGFEALIGYLYLLDNFERILYLVKLGLEKSNFNKWCFICLTILLNKFLNILNSLKIGVKKEK